MYYYTPRYHQKRPLHAFSRHVGKYGSSSFEKLQVQLLGQMALLTTHNGLDEF
jgi:hypothetical protein